jgi:hypothetical protein
MVLVEFYPFGVNTLKPRLKWMFFYGAVFAAGVAFGAAMVKMFILPSHRVDPVPVAPQMGEARLVSIPSSRGITETR